jgi:hypothetical protein
MHLCVMTSSVPMEISSIVHKYYSQRFTNESDSACYYTNNGFIGHNLDNLAHP